MNDRNIDDTESKSSTLTLKDECQDHALRVWFIVFMLGPVVQKTISLNLD